MDEYVNITEGAFRTVAGILALQTQSRPRSPWEAVNEKKRMSFTRACLLEKKTNRT